VAVIVYARPYNKVPSPAEQSGASPFQRRLLRMARAWGSAALSPRAAARPLPTGIANTVGAALPLRRQFCVEVGVCCRVGDIRRLAASEAAMRRDTRRSSPPPSAARTL
jgi:hypothetical protein